MTKNLTPGESVYGEKRISIANAAGGDDSAPATTTEYRVWNPFRSKLAAGILGGVDTIYMKPGSKVLYLGAASGTSVSHVADIVGPEGTVYAVEFSHRSGRDLINMVRNPKPSLVSHTDFSRRPTAPTLFLLLRMPVTLSSTACCFPWWTASLLMLLNLTKHVLSVSTLVSS